MQVQNRNFTTSLLVWFCITMFYCYQYILRVVPNIIMPDLMSIFDIDAGDFGSFAGIYYIGYIAIHIPVGMMLTRYGARVILPIAILITSIGIAPVIFSKSWLLVLVGRLLTGIGSSAAIVGALQIFRVLFPKNFTWMLGIMVSLGLITVVYAGVPLVKFISFVGLQSAMNVILYSGIILAVVTFFIIPKNIEKHHSDIRLPKKSNIFADFKSVLSNKRIIFVSLLAGLMVGPLEGFADAWGSVFLIHVYGFEKIIADNNILSIFLGMCVGCLVIPYIADRTSGHFATTIISGVVMAICFICLLNGYVSMEMIYPICLLIGFCCSYQVIIISKISTFVAEDKSGMAASVANMIVMTFGWVFHNSIGYLMTQQWDGTIQDGVRVYSSSAYTNSLQVIPIAMCIAVVGIFIISRVKVVNQQK